MRSNLKVLFTCPRKTTPQSRQCPLPVDSDEFAGLVEKAPSLGRSRLDLAGISGGLEFFDLSLQRIDPCRYVRYDEIKVRAVLAHRLSERPPVFKLMNHRISRYRLHNGLWRRFYLVLSGR